MYTAAACLPRTATSIVQASSSGPENFIVAFVDAKTGQVKTTVAGQSNLLPPLPVIYG